MDSPEWVVLKHEFTHYLERSKFYGSIKRFAAEYSARAGIDMAAVKQGIVAEYAAEGVPGDAEREFVAHFAASELFKSEKAIKAFVRSEQGAAGRVLNWIQYQIAITQARKNRMADNGAGESLLKAEYAYIKAFRDMRKAGNASGEAQYMAGKSALVDSLREKDLTHLDGFSSDVKSELASRAAMLSADTKNALYDKYVTDDMRAYIDRVQAMPNVAWSEEKISQTGKEYYEKHKATKCERAAVFIIGATASGKSSIAERYVEQFGAMLADCDPIAMAMDEYGDDGVGSNATHDVAKEVLHIAVSTALANGDNIVYPIVGSKSKKVAAQLQDFRDAGYKQVYLVYNDLPIEKSFIRNTSRYTHGETNEKGETVHRLVLPDYVLGIGNLPLATFVTMQKERSFDGYEAWSNDVSKGSDPVRIPLEQHGTHILRSRDGGLRDRTEASRGDNEGGSGTESVSTLFGGRPGGVTGQEAPEQGASSLGDETQYDIGMDFQALVDKYGAIKQGQDPRARDTQVPTSTDGDNRVSLAMRSAIESHHIDDSFVEQVMASVMNDGIGTHKAQTNAELLEAARDQITRYHGQAGALATFKNKTNDGSVNSRDVAVGMALLAEASSRGDTEGALDILSSLCVAATTAGRSVQAFRMLKELGGVGACYYMDKLVARMNNKYEKQIQNGSMEQIVLPENLRANLVNAKTKEEIAAAEGAVSAYIGQRLPLTLAQRLQNWRYFAMLGNFKTHARNILGNVAMAGMRTAKDVVAAGIESAAVKTGIMSESDRAHAVYSKRNQQAKTYTAVFTPIR